MLCFLFCLTTITNYVLLSFLIFENLMTTTTSGRVVIYGDVEQLKSVHRTPQTMWALNVPWPERYRHIRTNSLKAVDFIAVHRVPIGARSWLGDVWENVMTSGGSASTPRGVKCSVLTSCHVIMRFKRSSRSLTRFPWEFDGAVAEFEVTLYVDTRIRLKGVTKL